VESTVAKGIAAMAQAVEAVAGASTYTGIMWMVDLQSCDLLPGLTFRCCAPGAPAAQWLGLG